MADSLANTPPDQDKLADMSEAGPQVLLTLHVKNEHCPCKFNVLGPTVLIVETRLPPLEERCCSVRGCIDG